MKKIFFALILVLIINKTFSQNILNGDFENNTVDTCRFGIDNATFNSLIDNVSSFGASQSVCILKSGCDYVEPKNGNSCLVMQMTGLLADAISMKLSSSLIIGRKYLLTYYISGNVSETGQRYDSILIGLSNSTVSFGRTICKDIPSNSNWELRSFSFIAPDNSQYITVMMGMWSHNVNYIDNFNLTPCPLKVNLGKDTFICSGKKLILKATQPGATYLWQDGSTDSVYIVNQEGLYSVRVKYQDCIDNDSIQVNYFDCSHDCQLYIPNSFSPNNDGINDDFKVATHCPVESYYIQVYNRWGAKIFESNDINTSWDGTYNGRWLEQGCYYFQITAIISSMTFNKTGIIYLIR